MRRLLCTTLAITGAAVAHLELGAQDGPAPSIDLTLGGSQGSGGGPFRDRGGLALDVLVAGRSERLARGRLLAGLAAGAQGPMYFLGVHPCDGRAALGLPPCAPDFPVFFSVAALAGWEGGGPRTGSVSFLAGPGYYVEPDSGRAFGLQARVDLATPRLLRLALVASARGALLPGYRGSALTLTAFGLGLRLQ